MQTRLKKLFFLVVPFMAIFLLAPSAFAKKHKHCNPRYGQSDYDRSYYNRPYYDPSYYGRWRYNDRYYDRYGDDYYRRRTYSRPRYNDGYYGGSYSPPAGNFPWWDLLIPRY